MRLRLEPESPLPSGRREGHLLPKRDLVVALFVVVVILGRRSLVEFARRANFLLAGIRATEAGGFVPVEMVDDYSATTIRSYIKAVEHFEGYVATPLDELGQMIYGVSTPTCSGTESSPSIHLGAKEVIHHEGQNGDGGLLIGAFFADRFERRLDLGHCPKPLRRNFP